MNIALVNELAMFAHDMDINVWEGDRRGVLQTVRVHAVHSRPGGGGHCLPIDPSYLSWRVERALGKSFRFVELADDINCHMPDYAVNRIMMSFNNRERVKAALSVLDATPLRRCPALWDGRAGQRIAAALLSGGPSAGHPRPTDLSCQGDRRERSGSTWGM